MTDVRFSQSASSSLNSHGRGGNLPPAPELGVKWRPEALEYRGDMTQFLTGLAETLESLAQGNPDLWDAGSWGVTKTGQNIPVLLHRDAYLAVSPRTRVLLVSGASGNEADAALALGVLESYRSGGSSLSDRIALSAAPSVNPEGNGDQSLGYPPQDGYFFDAEQPESRYLWRWLCFQAPDIALEVRSGESVVWEANAAAAGVGAGLEAGQLEQDGSLLAALGSGEPDGLAPVPGLRLTAPAGALDAELTRLWNAVGALSDSERVSPARFALDARRQRSPVEVARVLASVYGHELDPVNYTQGVGISGRLRLARLDPEGDSPDASIVQTVAARTSGDTPWFGENPGGANLAGLIWAGELAEATGDARYAQLILDVANRYRPGEGDGAPPPCDPDFRTEDMFMAGAMLGRAYRQSGETRYLDILVKFMRGGEIQQDNGLFWHCRSGPFFWGRGNGFAALGLTETLTYLPEDHSDKDAILGMYRRLVDALTGVQTPSGMLLQLLDYPGSYQELTSTCMFGYSLARGLRRGWLDNSHVPALEMAWQAVSERVDDQGNVVDGCTGTGVQTTHKEYLDRPAVFGFDDRTGSMSLWFAVEMERWRRSA